MFLGYSEKDESLLKAVTGQGIIEAVGEIQGMVSYHNVNSNKVTLVCTHAVTAPTARLLPLLPQTDCRIQLIKHLGENLVLQAVLEEYDLGRQAGNVSEAEILNREKVRSSSSILSHTYHR